MLDGEKILGKGAYSKVVKVLHKQKKKVFALKVVF